MSLRPESPFLSSILLIIFVHRFAGHDTTAGTATIALHFLAHNPKWQAAIRQEVIEACGKTESISLEQLENLPALNATIKETLRLYPAAPSGGGR